eukprot:CAMPEP_0175105298 /NCGR_PEP_ID=MMETSP0086_2-20121207/10350_1 /TAXON_ID=136419 /ORGANISM="Unknown Unknown, Strain D1" /LENGTH=62 /DNA_ID=CAMNT_0016381075 /DNA_START=88 /DNA_END=273 /DNA_ORIENTATION=-
MDEVRSNLSKLRMIATCDLLEVAFIPLSVVKRFCKTLAKNGAKSATELSTDCLLPVTCPSVF